MATIITIDPLTRIEGHMKIEATVDSGVVKDARCSGTLFRGFEIILKGRDPRDAQRIASRVCGVCPLIHSIGASLCLGSAFGIAGKVPDNGRMIRNIMQGSNTSSPTYSTSTTSPPSISWTSRRSPTTKALTPSSSR